MLSESRNVAICAIGNYFRMVTFMKSFSCFYLLSPFYSEAVFKCRRYLWGSVILRDEEDGVLALERQLGAEVAPRLLTPEQLFCPNFSTVLCTTALIQNRNKNVPILGGKVENI